MTLFEAILKCKTSREHCFRPVAWIGEGDEAAYIVRKNRIVWATDPDVPAILCYNDVDLLMGDWQTLTLDRLRSEHIEATTGVET